MPKKIQINCNWNKIIRIDFFVSIDLIDVWLWLEIA